MTESDELGGDVVRAAFRCSRPSRYAGWVLPGGRVVPARCHAPNKCSYCAALATAENALLVALSCEVYGPPQVGVTLTTVDPQHDQVRFRRDVEQALKALRRRWPQVEYLGFVEWTTGKGARSGGHRRIHMHLLLRGLLPSEAEAAELVVRDVWEARTGASRVEVAQLRSTGAAVAYLVHHHRKADQSAPPGWSGKRLRPSIAGAGRDGFFGAEGTAYWRREAQRLLHDKRLRRVARRSVAWEDLDGAPDEILDREWSAALVAARAEAEAVTFVKLDRFGGIMTPRGMRLDRAAG